MSKKLKTTEPSGMLSSEEILPIVHDLQLVVETLAMITTKLENLTIVRHVPSREPVEKPKPKPKLQPIAQVPTEIQNGTNSPPSTKLPESEEAGGRRSVQDLKFFFEVENFSRNHTPRTSFRRSNTPKPEEVTEHRELSNEDATKIDKIKKYF